MSEPVLRLEEVGVRFGGLKAVDGVSLAVRRGERRAVIGPNGAGKTTLFNAVTGTVRPTSGRVIFEGRDVTGERVHRRASLGMGRTFQITNLFPTLTVGENMRLAMRGHAGRRKFAVLSNGAARAEERSLQEEALALSRLAVPTSTRVGALSYGAQRQLELAMTLASRPRLMLLDEPAAGLSPAERVIVADVIRSLPADITVILIEHDMDLVLSLSEWVTCLNNGRFLAEGAPDDIRRNEAVQDVYLGRVRAPLGSA